MSRVRLFGAGLILFAIPASAEAQTGAVAGRVWNAQTQQPVPSAQVTVTGTNRSAITNADGEYLITRVPAGRQLVRATSIGYAQATRQIVVAAAGTATIDFALEMSAVELGAIIVNSVTGQAQTKKEIAASVGTIATNAVSLGPVRTLDQLIQGRVAGAVVLQSSGTTGSGSRIRIRGSNSISLSNAPLVVVDGIRVQSDERSLGFEVGGQEPSRLNDLNLEDIESIDVLKGPAASSLYGTSAASGVIIVTTRHGRKGQPLVRTWAEYDVLEQATDFPDNVYAAGNLVAGPGLTLANPVGRCDNMRRAIGADPGPGEIGCTGVTQRFRFNPLGNPMTTPFANGSRRTAGGSVSGGGESATFYVSGEYEGEDGVLPQSDLRRLRVRGNLTGEVGQRLTIGANFGFLESELHLPLGDNALYGIVPMGLFGNPQPSFVQLQQGFESAPAFFFDWKTSQQLSRFMGAVTASYRPLPWLSINGTFGLDRHARTETNRIPRLSAYNIFGSIYSEGFIQNYDFDIYNFTGNASGSAIFDLAPGLLSTTTLGVSYLREDHNQVYAFGATLTPGVEESLAGANTDFEVDEASILNATVGAFAQQQIAWRDRVFVNGAIRGDRNTAFGTDIGWIWYPSLSAAWVLFDGSSDLRLRAAWGESGLRPGATDAVQSFSSAIGVFENGGVPAIVIDETGNAELEPERSMEWEAGLDVGLYDGRVGLEATYFRKVTSDALVNKPLPPSLGGSATRLENLGRVENDGFELLVNSAVVRTATVNLELVATATFVDNTLLELGEDARGNAIAPAVFGFGSTQRHVSGYPLGGFWDNPIVRYADANGDGLLSVDEVVVDADSVAYLGNPFPVRELTFGANLGLRDWLRVSALLDYEGGHELINYTRAWRCGNAMNCADLYDASTPLDQQAAIVGRAAYDTFAGFIENADFMKLREVAVVLGLPAAWARRAGVERLAVTLAGRNLATWTGYSGLDPEVAFAGQANFMSGDFGTLPPNRIFSVRLDASF